MITSTVNHYTVADFRRRAAAHRLPPRADDYGDHRLNPELAQMFVHDRLKEAAVLVPVVDRPGEASVILTQRSGKLRSHSGEISFPGGRLDPADPTAEFAALRETEEEIGLTSDFIEVVGRLPDYVTGSGFRIVPVLSVVKPGFMLTINEDEVEDAFEVPLGFLMDPANHTRNSRIWNNRERFFYTMPFGDRYIWGITAGIIRVVYERLYA